MTITSLLTAVIKLGLKKVLVQEMYSVETLARVDMLELPAFASLNVRGLMTLAMHTTDEPQVRQCFALLRDLRDRLRQDAPQGAALAELSMGMSGDFEWAIEEGATTVRVGQAIFGARSLPDSHYWPEGKA